MRGGVLAVGFLYMVGGSFSWMLCDILLAYRDFTGRANNHPRG